MAQPDWNKLRKLGKLPSNSREKIPELKEIDVLKEKIEELKNGMCDECKEKLLGEKNKEFKCEVEGCGFVTSAEKYLKVHTTKSHKNLNTNES